MKTVVEFPDKGVLAEEAAEWLIRLDADTPPSSQELRALGEWLHRSPAHREELEKLAALWGRMNILTELAVPLGTSGERPDASRRTSWLRHAVVAAAVGALFAGGLVYLLRGSAENGSLTAKGLYATAVGQQTTTELPDGSQIILNTNSQIRVDYSDRYRRVYLLQGEALFTVAENATRPFRVYAGARRIQALGTAFSVYLHGPDVQVTVTEGRVAIASIEAPRSALNLHQASAGDEDEWVESLGTLSAGQVATIRSPAQQTNANSGRPLATVAPVQHEELVKRLAWREGVLMFSGETLEDVVKEVSRYTTVSIEILDPAIRNMRIGGRFPVGETEVMLAALESSFNLRVTRFGHNRVVITATEP